jgi:electron transport complex protein RnfA
MEYVFIFIAAVFVNNIVLAQFLGICPFLGVSKSVPTALGMTGAVTFVMILATLVTFIVQKTVLDPFGIGFMQTIVFILIIAALVQMVEIILKKVSPSLYQALGVFLPLITTNCAVLGVAIMVIQKDYNLLESVVFAASTALGFGLALTIFAGIREQLELSSIPQGMKGTPIALVTAGLLAMAFMGFSGVDKPSTHFPIKLTNSSYTHPVKSESTRSTLSCIFSLGFVVAKPTTFIPARCPASIPEKESSKTQQTSGSICNSRAANK